MSNASTFGDYVCELRGNIERGDATEHTHRPALKTLLESVDPDITDFSEKGPNEIDRVIFTTEVVQASRLQTSGETDPPSAATETTGRVHINATQTFGGIPVAVWSFRVGGYQVCEKWLKDRKSRTLDYADIQHYQKIVVALRGTIRLMASIDQAIEVQGGWPGAFDSGVSELAGTRPLGLDSRLPRRSQAQKGSCSSEGDASPSKTAWQVSAPFLSE